MVDLTKYILQALYEATGHTGQAVDVVATLRGRWPQLRAEDVRLHLSDLSARGSVSMRSDGFGQITGAGIRGLSELWREGAFGAVPASAAPHVERLHALAAAQADSDEESNNTQPYSLSQVKSIAEEKARRAQAGHDTEENPAYSKKGAAPAASAVDMQIDYMRRAVEVVIQEISAANELPMEEWANALEITAQMDASLDSLNAILHR